MWLDFCKKSRKLKIKREKIGEKNYLNQDLNKGLALVMQKC